MACNGMKCLGMLPGIRFMGWAWAWAWAWWWVVAWTLGLDFHAASAAAASRPNVVWIVVEDMSAHWSCYGPDGAPTPVVDGLAARGVRFERAFVTGPICSISRSALITGCYQTAIGAQHHRSSNAAHPIRLPAPVRPVTPLLREAGYHVNNLDLEGFLDAGRPVKVAKTDYNFEWDAGVCYDARHWTARPGGKPFFVQVQLHGGKRRGEAPGPRWPEVVRSTLGGTTDVASVRLPAWLPRDPVILADWAQYLDTVRMMDHEVGRVLACLREAGELERTVVFVWTDHGVSHVRAKQFLYDAGIRVPLVVAGPGIGRGEVRRDMVEHIDIAASTLVLAGLRVPAWMHGRDLFEPGRPGREFVFAARDRADETVDRIRSARSERFKYIRNHYPTRPWLQPNRYKDEKAILAAMRRLHAEGALDGAQSLVMAAERPREELYDLEADPNELRNLAGEPAWAGGVGPASGGAGAMDPGPWGCGSDAGGRGGVREQRASGQRRASDPVERGVDAALGAGTAHGTVGGTIELPHGAWAWVTQAPRWKSRHRAVWGPRVLTRQRHPAADHSQFWAETAPPPCRRSSGPAHAPSRLIPSSPPGWGLGLIPKDLVRLGGPAISLLGSLLQPPFLHWGRVVGLGLVHGRVVGPAPSILERRPEWRLANGDENIAGSRSAACGNLLQHLHGVRDGAEDEAEAINGAGRLAGKTQDQRGAHGGGKAPGQDRVGRQGKALHSHDLAEPRDLLVGDGADGLRGDVAARDAGAARGQDKVGSARGACADCALDGRDVVRDDFLGDDEPSVPCGGLPEGGATEVLVHARGGPVGDGDDADVDLHGARISGP